MPGHGREVMCNPCSHSIYATKRCPPPAARVQRRLPHPRFDRVRLVVPRRSSCRIVPFASQLATTHQPWRVRCPCLFKVPPPTAQSTSACAITRRRLCTLAERPCENHKDDGLKRDAGEAGTGRYRRRGAGAQPESERRRWK